MTAFPAARPSLTVKSGARYPAGVANGTGIATVLAAGLITSSLSYAALMPPADFEEGEKYVAVLNLLTGQYEKRELTSELAEPLEAEKYRVIPIGHPKYAEWGGYAANHARWQALITKAQTTGRPVQLGIGTYEIAALDWPPNVSLFGYGQTRTIVKFVGGHAENLLRFPLPAAYCDNLAYAPIEWRDVEIDFNGPAQTSGHGIVIQSPGTVGFYGTCPVFSGVRMLNAKENTFMTEFGRNMMRLFDCRINSGGSGHAVFISGAMDSKIDRCYIGEHYSGVGIYFYSGSGLNITNTHVYANKNNLRKDAGGYDLRAANSDFDRAQEDAVILYGNATGRGHHDHFLGCTFVYSSKKAGSNGVYSDFQIYGAVDLVIDGAHIPYYGGAHEATTKYFIRFDTWSGYTPVPARIMNLQYDPAATSASPPLWATDFTNDWTKVCGLINSKFGFRQSSATAFGLYCNDVAVWNYASSYSATSYAIYVSNNAVVWQKTAAGADEKKSAIQTTTHNGKELTGIVFRNDADSTGTLAFGVKRTGYAFATLYSGLLPTSSAGLASGDYWRDAAAGNVIKQVP